MKKVLALVVVLAMVGLANAGLQYQINGADYVGSDPVWVTNKTVTVSLFNSADQAAAYEIGGVALNGDAAFVSGAVNAANLPGSWSVTNYGLQDGYGEVFAINYDTPAVAPTKAGVLFTFTFDFTKKYPAQATIGMLDANWGAMGAPVTVNYIPEPMTLSLLGLGALALRRRS